MIPVLSPHLLLGHFYTVEQTILRYDALNLIDSGEAFSLSFTTCDRHRGTGGVLKEVTNWVKVKQDKSELQIPGRTLNRQEKSGLHQSEKQGGIKLFNIYNPLNPRDHIIAVHYRLMHFLNGKRIID